MMEPKLAGNRKEVQDSKLMWNWGNIKIDSGVVYVESGTGPSSYAATYKVSTD